MDYTVISLTNPHTIRGRPTLKDVERFRVLNGSFHEFCRLKAWLLLRVEEHRTRHQNGMGKRETLSLIYDKCMQPGSLNRDKLMH